MTEVVPSYAIVRPRAVASDRGDPRLLEDLIAEVADELTVGVLWIVGGPGSGKSTAIAHLASLYRCDPRFEFFDDPTEEDLNRNSNTSLLVAATTTPAGRSGIVLRLLPWGTDDLVEYLLAVAPDECNSVMARLGAARRSRIPQLARVVLDRFAADPSLTELHSALAAEVRSQLPKPRHFAAATEYCLAMLVGESAAIVSTSKLLERIRCPRNVIALLRHKCVQTPLAADRLVAMLSSRVSLRCLMRTLPNDLVELVGNRCRDNSVALKRLRGLLASPRASAYQSMAASILRFADPTWRPRGGVSYAYDFSRAILHGVNWHGAILTGADLRKADFAAANLQDGNLDEANATSAQFPGADLRRARLVGICASHADFRSANLTAAKMAISELAHASFAGANLSGATLVKADLASIDLSDAKLNKADLLGAQLGGAVLVDTDFTDAKLDETILVQADLRRAILHGVSFANAVMSHAQLEDVVVRRARLCGARLEYAHLTGSDFADTDFHNANLAFAHLAEIDWPGADLRGADLHGASFHMGSSRSGLVGSPIACEGSKTGFYTDDREEMHFRHPEEIRKANLRGADLRRANIANVDLYLVDLRDARLDPDQIVHARHSGAILDDWEID